MPLINSLSYHLKRRLSPLKKNYDNSLHSFIFTWITCTCTLHTAACTQPVLKLVSLFWIRSVVLKLVGLFWIRSMVTNQLVAYYIHVQWRGTVCRKWRRGKVKEDTMYMYMYIELERSQPGNEALVSKWISHRLRRNRRSEKNKPTQLLPFLPPTGYTLSVTPSPLHTHPHLYTHPPTPTHTLLICATHKPEGVI